MTKLFYLILLAVVVFGFGNQMTSAQASELPTPHGFLDQSCLGSIDPLNPSPLTYTDRVILAVACKTQENSRSDALFNDTLTYTDRYILYWTRSDEE